MSLCEVPKLANFDLGNGTGSPAAPFNNGGKRSVVAHDRVSRTRTRVKACRNSSETPPSAVSRMRRDVGTGLAISNTNTGGAMLLSPGVLRRGKRSTALGVREVENILAAAVNTGEIQAPLNRFTTIHFEAAGLVDPVHALGRLIKLAGDWLRTKGSTLAYIWVRETGVGKGEHAHILWHVPTRLTKEFARREKRWRKRIGARVKRGAFKSLPVGRSYRHAEVGIQYGEAYSDNLESVIAYLVKGASSKAAKQFGLTWLEDGGELWGKRYGVSENLNRTARSRNRSPV